jgi:hypothetical protein
MTMTVADLSLIPDTVNDALIGEVDIPGWRDTAISQR